MRLRSAAGAAALVFAVLGAGPSVSAATSVGRADTADAVCHLHDDRIDEASGIDRGIASPDVLYVQNDSGDTNRFFALDARTCATVATVTVPDARNVDWEDLAVAPDAAGTPSVWLADIGDNSANRSQITVYRVDEPRIRASDRAVRTDAPDVWRLRYPVGPTDAESLAVTPRGVGYIVTKSLLGASTVYRLPARPDPGRVQVLTRVGSIQFVPSSGGGPVELAEQAAATSAAISRDGTLFAVRTYTDAYLWRLTDGDVAAALRTSPTRIALPHQLQGEGIAFDAGRLLIDSEGRGSAVYSVPITLASAAPASSSSADASPTSSPSASGSASRVTPSSSGTSAGKGGGGNGSWIPGLVVLTLVVLGAVGWWTLQLRGRAGR
jgi:hypothetical protein